MHHVCIPNSHLGGTSACRIPVGKATLLSCSAFTQFTNHDLSLHPQQKRLPTCANTDELSTHTAAYFMFIIILAMFSIADEVPIEEIFF